jgi:hypothetical protein
MPPPPPLSFATYSRLRHPAPSSFLRPPPTPPLLPHTSPHRITMHVSHHRAWPLPPTPNSGSHRYRQCRSVDQRRDRVPTASSHHPHFPSARPPDPPPPLSHSLSSPSLRANSRLQSDTGGVARSSFHTTGRVAVSVR